jgi:hypothetical protein
MEKFRVRILCHEVNEYEGEIKANSLKEAEEIAAKGEIDNLDFPDGSSNMLMDSIWDDRHDVTVKKVFIYEKSNDINPIVIERK